MRSGTGGSEYGVARTGCGIYVGRRNCSTMIVKLAASFAIFVCVVVHRCGRGYPLDGVLL